MYSLVLSIGYKFVFSSTNQHSESQKKQPIPALQKGSRVSWPSLKDSHQLPMGFDANLCLAKTWALAESIPEGGAGASQLAGVVGWPSSQPMGLCSLRV